ncbi:hypothetical protein CCGE531_12050 [Rhizobium sp. CCGE531]|nr:hypothetical protein CCGE531_12050 [Rhizobium sp. CCGE531]AYG74607.1 hypothetical protein CCGE532_11475 [Rhizobium sp. CCGE532]
MLDQCAKLRSGVSAAGIIEIKACKIGAIILQDRQQLSTADEGAEAFLHSEGDAGTGHGKLDHHQGRYEVRGNHIDYWDDTGFTADGDFIDDVLHHGGMILHRQK